MRWVFLAALLLAGCRETPAPPLPSTPPPPECGAAEVLAEGRCEPLFHRHRCPPGSMSQVGSAECVPVGTTHCAEGFAADPNGWGCAAVVAPSCGPGSRRALGRTDCVPVGVPTCDPGFERDASGFGCREIAASGCTGATRAQLGRPTCVPVGDCAAPFPPANATLFVKRGYTPAQLDATHFDSLGAALAAATAGAVIAVDEGVYAESLDITVPVQLFGRCPAMVRLDPPQGSTARVIDVFGARATISGMTVGGHTRGAQVRSGGALGFADMVFEANVSSAVVCTDSSLALRRSVIRDSRSRTDGTFGRGLDLNGCAVSLEDVHLQRNHEIGLRAGDASEVSIKDLFIEETQPNDAGQFGEAVRLVGGARLTGTGLVARGNHRSTVVVQGASALEVSAAVLADPLPFGGNPAALALTVSGASASLARTTIRGSLGAGVSVLGGTVSVRDSAIDRVLAPVPGALSTGMDVAGGSAATLDGVAVVGNDGFGLRAVGSGTSLAVRRSLLTGNAYLGLMASAKAEATIEDCELSKNLAGVVTTNAESRVAVRRSLVVESRNTSPDPNATYGGLLVSDEATLEAEGCLVADNEDFGAMLESGGALALKDSVVRGNRSVRFAALGDGAYVRASTFSAADTTFLDNSTTNVRSDSASTVTLSDSVVRQERASKWLVGVATSGRARLVRTAVVDTQLIALAGLDTTSELGLEGCLVGPTHGISGQHGYGLISVGRFEVVGSEVRDSEVAGIVASAGTGSVRSTLLRGNTVALHPQQGSTLVESDGTAPEPLEVLLSPDTVLLDNATRVGTGTLALPGLGGP